MKLLTLFALLACGVFAEEGPQCQPPNGGGLQSILDEIVALIPTEEAVELFVTAIISDRETQAVMEYLSSPDFREIVTLVQNQPTFISFLEFFCSELYFDAAYYFNVLANIYGFPEVHIQSRATAHTAGFHGLLLDILHLIPVDEARALLEEKFATDYYVQLAFQKINSDEFGSIIEALHADPTYNNMKDRLRGLGFDIELIIDVTTKIFKPEVSEVEQNTNKI